MLVYDDEIVMKEFISIDRAGNSFLELYVPIDDLSNEFAQVLHLGALKRA